jgi:hypothetical protein|eukprot:CAMPEP_0174282706 /NCGR_PEP_ID=MMETSP0809-20121228/3255_1 /TAXON_ID=73025 ORGANISM="Eutreptiella gymnastica-like, Strain CCMP1594" /NCGR_SAMPLE_ID=MMETSP0809 /ASSEMBLY_ACC=CAM_ASM_000658 /LENGTH=251 /DNA_ID=CAMNT_0015377103 /DNA_START=30 /DNA_END=785 /DNA_ORIENTATION=-
MADSTNCIEIKLGHKKWRLAEGERFDISILQRDSERLTLQDMQDKCLMAVDRDGKVFVQNGHSYKVVPVGHLEAPPTGGAHKKGATARTLFMKEERDKIKGSLRDGESFLAHASSMFQGLPQAEKDMWMKKAADLNEAAEPKDETAETSASELMAKDKKREQEDGKQLPPAKKAKTDAKPSAAKLPAKSSTTKPAAKKSAVPKKTDAPKAPPKTGPANVHKSPVKATNAPKAAHQKRASIDADDDDGDQSD